MSVLPSDRAVKRYVGSWGEWMESVGVSWEDANQEPDPCEGCPHMNDFPEECPLECPYKLEYRLVAKYGETASWSQEYFDQSYDALIELAEWIIQNFKLEPRQGSSETKEVEVHE